MESIVNTCSSRMLHEIHGHAASYPHCLLLLGENPSPVIAAQVLRLISLVLLPQV
jgi:hypothetical protein